MHLKIKRKRDNVRANLIFLLKEFSATIKDCKSKEGISDREKETLGLLENAMYKLEDGVITPEKIIEISILQLKLNKYQKERE